MNSKLSKLLRPNIIKAKAYSSARDEFSGKDGIFMDANENPFDHELGYNRYPDPYQWEIKEKLSQMKGVSIENIFLGNGSDEAIDALIRAFCEPAVDNMIIMPPTYGMYEFGAGINNIQLKEVSLTVDFQINVKAVLDAIDQRTKIIFICSPNNPSGNSLDREAIKEVISNFEGIVVLDEAYIDFCPEKTFLKELNQYPNLVILQTFSKAWGLAGIRLGMAFADKEIIKVLNKVKPPYNVNKITQGIALKALNNEAAKDKVVQEIITERKKLEKELQRFDFVIKIYPSDANFLLVKTTDAKKIYQQLVKEKIIVRDRSSVTLCEECLRVTVGTVEQNKQLIESLKNIKIQ